MSQPRNMLITNAELYRGECLDVRCQGERIVEIGKSLQRTTHEKIIDAKRCALLPGLHDHHMHLLSLAASLSSVQCGPPHVENAGELSEVLNTQTGKGWIRGVGYHESVAGDLTNRGLDQLCDWRPIRIQHRSGRLWVLNSLALRELEITDDQEGQLYRADEDLRSRLSTRTDLHTEVQKACSLLLSMGITGITDATPTNDEHVREMLQKTINVPLHMYFMGNEDLTDGPLKLLIDDYRLPDIDTFVQRIKNSHQRGRSVAIHCVSRPELVFALSALKTAGCNAGDRIEHASVVHADTLSMIKELRLTIVTQLNFIRERGDQYLMGIQPDEVKTLYRVRSFKEAGVAVAFGTDAPFGSPDPWSAMDAAVTRTTESRRVISDDERVTPDQALGMFLTRADDPGGNERQVAVGERADLCLLSHSWSAARNSLTNEAVRMTIVNGKIVFDQSAAA